MENFPQVLALARAALGSDNPSARRNVTKLKTALSKQGQSDQADALAKLLESADKASALAPSRVVLSSTSVVERMSPTVNPPVDRETGAPLASIEFPMAGRVLEEPILQDELRDAIDTLMSEWKSAGVLAAAGIRPPLNLLLYGVPGTGKTLLAHAVAAQLELPLVVARLDGLISSFLGTTARNIAALFEFANRYDCILLLDEFDAVAKVRDDPHEIGEIKRVVNTLLQCLDGRREIGFTIAVTNHEHLLDAAIWRRFDSRISVPVPGAVTRRTMVTRFMSALALEPVEIDFVAWLTDGLSGAEIETMCYSVRRFVAMSAGDKAEIVGALRVNALLSANLRGSERQNLLVGDQEALARALTQDEDFKFTQDALAQLFSTTQPTISRWIRK